MDVQSEKRVEKVIARKTQRMKWVCMTASLMLVVVCATAYILKRPAIGMTEADGHVLNCQLQVHQHTPECYNEEGAFICGEADFVVHSHDSSCYDEEGTLLCTLPEIAEHVHDDSCLRQQMICSQEEGEDHVHDASCMEPILLCGKDEVVLHVHGTDCYDDNGELICGQIEVMEHTHGAECFETAGQTEEPTEESRITEDEDVAVEAQITESEHSEDVQETVETETVIEPESMAETAAAVDEETTTQTETDADTEPATDIEAATEAETSEEGSAIQETTAVSGSRKTRARAAAAASDPTLQYSQEIIDISLGETVTTPTIQKGKRVYYRYQNNTTHTVKIESVGSADTYVHLMDADGKQINYNDDSGSGSNFKLSVTLEPGACYYWGVRFYSNTVTGTITFSLVRTEDHSYVDGVCACGRKQNECGDETLATDLTWSLDESGVMNIVGNGAMENYGTFLAPWSAVKSQIAELVIGPGVTSVGSGTFNGCKRLQTVTIQSQNLESIGDNAFSNCAALKKIVIGSTVDTLSGTNLDRLAQTGAQVCFQGPNVLTLTDSAQSVANVVMPAGRYYVNESGAVYLLGEGTATLIDCPAELDSSDLSPLLYDFTTPEGETYTVTAISERVFAGFENLTSITIPATVTDIGSSAFEGCSNLAQVNGGTTLEEVAQSLPNTTIRYSTFFGTALWEYTVSSDLTLFTNENLELSKKDDGNHYRLQLKVTEGVGASWVDSTYGTLYTGQSVQITINLDQTETSVSDKLRIYFQMQDGNSVYDAEKNTLFGNEIGAPQTYTSNGKEVVGTFYLADADENLYYLELSSMDPGDTLTMYLNASYPNFTAGGEMLCWLDDSEGQEQPAAIKRIKWITKRDSFTLSKTSGSSGVVIKGDGTGNDLTWVSGLSYTIRTTRDGESISYGKNPMDHMDFTDTLTLPEGFSISQDVIDAIQKGNWYTKRVLYPTYSWDIYVTINQDGTSKDIVLAKIGMGGSSYLDLAQNIEPLINDQNQLQLCWRFVNQAEQTEILLPSMSVTYGDSVICGDAQTLKAFMEADPNQTSFKTVFHNEVEQTQSFRFGGVEQKQAEADKTVTIGQASFVISKSTSNYPAMGMDNTYTITLTNNTAFPYTNLEQVYDEMPDRYYIKPENIQKMFETSDGQKLTITISNAKICKTDSKTVTAIDGNTYTINQELTSDHSTYNIGQSGSDREGGLANLVLSWDGDHLKLVMTPSSDADAEQTYTIGAEQDYETIQALFDDLGIIVIKQTRYKCLWNQEGVTLRSGEAKKFLIYSTAKSTFQYLETDQRRESMTASNSGYIYNYAYAKYSGSTTATKYSYAYNYVYKDFTLRKTAVKSGKTVDEQTELVAGDILTYTNSITRHASGTAFDVTPLVDQMAGGQILLVEQAVNPDLAQYDLETKEVDGTAYYVMSRPGTYKNVTIGGYLADTLEIQQNDTGLQTRMYWYLKSSATSINVTYKAVIDPSVVTSGDGNGVTYTLRNDVWLGDHEGHRLYDTTFFNGITLSTSKYIVTNCDQVDGTHQPQTDELAKYSLVQSGQQVLYRIAITSVGEDYTLMLPGSAIKDTLPGSVENGWSKEDISITYIAEKGSTVTISDETSDAWTVVNGTVDSSTGKSTQYIQWNDGFFMQVKGTVYIYVTLTFPEGDDWEDYTHAYGSESLYNTWQIYNVTDQVEHLTSCQAKGVLQKGVYYTGTTTSTVAKTSNAYKNYSQQSSANSRLYYTNDTNGYGLVTYYAVLYNSGDSRLYVSQLQDVLPKGFTFCSLYYSTSLSCYYNMYSSSNYTSKYYYYYNWLDGINGDQKVSITNLKASLKASTFNNSDGRQVVTFTVTGASSDTPTLNYDERTGKCYLNPGQAFVIMYNCYTNGYDDTEDDAVNSISMPYDDYNGGGITLEEDVSFTPNKNTSITANDGNALLLSSSQAASLGVSTDGQTDNTRWLASQVTISRGRIQPGIQKTCSVSNAGSKETIEWKVQSTNSGTDALRDYVITDVMMAPYTFDGEVRYQVSGSSTSSVKLFDISQLKAEGEGETEFTSSFGKITARLDRNADGNQVLTIHFQDAAKAGIPAGGSSVLTVYTKNTTSTHENKTYINRAYLTPMKQIFSKGDVHQGNYTTYTCAGEETARRSVASEAQVIVSFGYATSAHKTVTELEQGQDGTLAVTDNSARSDKTTNSIILSDGEDSIFRYDLSINNSGSATATPTNMDLFVLVDNLPEVGDHATFYQDYARSSEFRVDFLAENLDLTVTLTRADGTVRQMNADEYDLMFSTQTEFDYDDSDAYSKKLWTGEALTQADGWYTLEQCQQSGTLAEMRSVRVVIKDPGHAKDIMPGGVTIAIDFNARVHQGSNPDHSAIAWNSFGYLYEVDGAQLQSAPEKVGVKIVGAPYLEKQLQDYRGAAVTAEQDETFQFLIYKGKNQNLDSTDSIEHLMEQLAANKIAFTVATRTVPAGANTSTSLPMDDLKKYVYDEQTGSWIPGSESWIWEDNATYTLMEVSTASDSAYSFYTLDGGRTNGMTFQYDETSSPEYVAVNQLKTWMLEVKKQDEVSGEALSGAIFGLYTLKPELAMQAADLPEALKEQPQMTISRDGQTWYLMDVKTSDANGDLSWTALTEDSYYLYELQAPDSYMIRETEGIRVTKQLNGKEALVVKNIPTYILPKTGGTGVIGYGIWGTGLVLLALMLWILRKKTGRC